MAEQVKKKLSQFMWCLLLTLHLILVYIVPSAPLFLAIKFGNVGLIVAAVLVFILVQIPIMFYAATKPHNLIEKLLEKIHKN